jgi:hypothetical protein
MKDLANLITALAALITSLIAFVSLRKQRKAIEVVHGIVNSQRTDMTNRIDQLIDTVHATGTSVPAAPAPTPPSTAP